MALLALCFGACSDEGVPILDNPNPTPNPNACTDGTKRDCDMGGGTTGDQVCSAGQWGACQAKPCTDGATLPCTQTSGQPGQKVCQASAWTACGPIPGQCQEGTLMPCTTADNAEGTKSCNQGAWGPCEPKVAPICQEGDKQACTTACGVGDEICVNGGWQNCDAPKPAQEICDGYDNNCDGAIDEVCGCVHGQCEVCYTGPEPTLNVGTCKVGQRCCVTGQWAACTAQVLPAKEDCSDTLDNDCDGTVNNGCTCTAGATQFCGTNIGECSMGQQTCQTIAGGGLDWGPCLGGVTPVAEAPLGCDGKDNDCDGAIDNGMTPDADEVNDSCGQARHKTVDDDGKTVTFAGTLYPKGDVDYFRVSVNEVTAILLPDPCNPLCYEPWCTPRKQCFFLEAKLIQPAGATYEATLLSGGTCTSPNQSFTTTNKIELQWGGTCNLDDTRDLWIKVAPKAGASPTWSCANYVLKLTVDKTNSKCPSS